MKSSSHTSARNATAARPSFSATQRASTPSLVLASALTVAAALSAGCRTRAFFGEPSPGQSKVGTAASGSSTGPTDAGSTPRQRTFTCDAPTAPRSVATITAPTQPTLTYHWTNDEEVLTPTGLAAWMARKFDAARDVPLAESGNAFGEGLYLASHPISTAGLGRILVVVPLVTGCVFARADDVDWERSAATRSALESAQAGVVYPFDAGERAVVVRGPEAIERGGIRVVDTRVREGEPLESFATRRFAEATPWTEAASALGAAYSFAAASLVKDPTTGAPLLDPSGALTSEGYAIALHAELTSGGDRREKALDALISAAPTRLDFPVCARREERFPYRGSKYHECVGALFESVAVHVAPSLSSSEGESPIGVEEAHAVLGALGYGPLLPAITSAQKPFYTEFFARWKAVNGKMPAAEALVKGSLLFGRTTDSTSLEDWR